MKKAFDKAAEFIPRLLVFGTLAVLGFCVAATLHGYKIVIKPHKHIIDSTKNDTVWRK